MEKKENFKAIDKMRCILTWCDFQHDDFIAKFQTIGDVEKCFDACHEHGIEFADKLTWDTEDPNYVNDPQYLLAKDVNRILMDYHYNVGELTFPMLTQAKKDFVELLQMVETIDFNTAYHKLNGYNRQDNDLFDCNYKSITATVTNDFNDECALLPNVEVWDNRHIQNFRESFDELLYQHGFGCTAVHDNLFTRQVDVRDVLGLPGHKFNVGSESLRKFLEGSPKWKEYLESIESAPKLYVPDDVFWEDYFKLVEKVRIALFIIYEEWCTTCKQEILDDYAFYTEKRVNDINDMTDEDWTKFMQAVENVEIDWRGFIKSHEL